jgi:hypothetical protein
MGLSLRNGGKPSGKLLLAAVTAAVAAAVAQAQPVEVTLLGGIRLGGELTDPGTSATHQLDTSSSFGVGVGLPLKDDRVLELLWTHQAGRVPGAGAGGSDLGLDLDTIGLGGTYEWPRRGYRPFVSGTAGVTVMSPQPAGLDRDVLATLTLGGGVKVPLSTRVGLRLEGRGVGMFSVGGASGVCGGGTCLLTFGGSGLLQLELLAGLSITF